MGFYILYHSPHSRRKLKGTKRKSTEFLKWPKTTPCRRKHAEPHWFTDKKVMFKSILSPLLQEGQKFHQQVHFRKGNIQWQQIEKRQTLVLMSRDMHLWPHLYGPSLTQGPEHNPEVGNSLNHAVNFGVDLISHTLASPSCCWKNLGHTYRFVSHIPW